MRAQDGIGGESPRRSRRDGSRRPPWKAALLLLLGALGCGGDALPGDPLDGVGVSADPQSERPPVEIVREPLQVRCEREADCAWLGGAACVANRCVPCRRHAECGSGVCDVSLPTWVGPGRCLSEARVLYVDAGRCGGAACGSVGGGSGTKADPFCTMAEAFARVDAAKDVVRVGPGLYCPFGIEGKRAAVYGDDVGVSQIDEEDVGGLRVRNSELLVDRVVLGRTSTFGLRCTADAGVSKVSIRRSTVLSDVGTALVAEGCELRVDRSRLSGLYGAADLTGTRYRITNSVISDVGERTAVRLHRGAGRISFSTVVRNGDASGPGGFPGAIDCGAAPGTARIEDSIVYGNLPGPSGSQLGGACTLSRVVVGTADGTTMAGAIRKSPALDGERLPRNAANLDCCIDKAGIHLDVPFDFAGSPRPTGFSWDIGAYEAPRF